MDLIDSFKLLFKLYSKFIAFILIDCLQNLLAGRFYKSGVADWIAILKHFNSREFIYVAFINCFLTLVGTYKAKFSTFFNLVICLVKVSELFC